ncbi:Receptor-like protein 43, partial [Linum perenne]
MSISATQLASWNASTECCEWPGIRCDPDGLGRVVTLHLSAEFISGGLNSKALFSLNHLQALDLSNNQDLRTTIPAELANLTHLRYLNLSNAGFFGQIPAAISRLTGLTSLDLSYQDGDLKLENPNLDSLVHNLTQLTDLRLDEVDLSAQGKEWCHALSSSLPNLRVLSLYNCLLSGPIDPSLSKLDSLSILQLDENNFFSPVPDSFAELKSLTSLTLSNCGLVGTFPAEILQIPSLKTLDVSVNKFLQGVLPDFPQSHSMEVLNLGETSFNGVLPPSIGNLKDLTLIDVSKCNFSGTIPKTLESLNQLENLDFSSNNFTGSIPRFIFELERLSYLSLPSNRFNGSVELSWIQTLQNLTFLDLSYNNLTVNAGSNNTSASSLFPQLIELIKSTLRVVILRNNLFHGQIWCSYDHLGTWKRLQIVDLAFNNFTGPLNTKYLATWEGMMVGGGKRVNEPIKFGTMNDLYYQDSIRLTSKGHQMEFVKILAIVKSIDFSSNNFDGPIPEVIGKFKALYALNFSHNAFSGQIPNAFGNLSSLESLDLSDNNLSGHIPKELASLTFISALNLSNNHLVGSIPTGSQFQTLENTSFGGVECGNTSYEDHGGHAGEPIVLDEENENEREPFVVGEEGAKEPIVLDEENEMPNAI